MGTVESQLEPKCTSLSSQNLPHQFDPVRPGRILVSLSTETTPRHAVGQVFR